MPTFMNRKLKPQTSDRKAKRIRQCTGRRAGRAGPGLDCGEEGEVLLMVVRCTPTTA